MEGKLIKVDSEYKLFQVSGHDGTLISVSGELSLKNCQAIENGYDLDELAEKEYFDGCDNTERSSEIYRRIFKAGFQKALEILGDKKFDEEDILIAIEAGYHSGINYNVDEEESGDKIIRLKDSVIQSLQQTEWDVEIKMVFNHIPKNNGIHNAHTIERVPKLDENGCLILKRK